MKLTTSDNIYYTWNGENKSIPEKWSDPQLLASKLYAISQGGPYSPSLQSLHDFCQRSFFHLDSNCFSCLFISFLEDEIVGFLTVQVTFENADIDFICTAHNFKRKHIAHHLMKKFEQVASHSQMIENLTLEVGQTNLQSILFYEKIGYKTISLRKKYYQNMEDALIMNRKINP